MSGSFGLRGDIEFCDAVDALDWEEFDREGGIELRVVTRSD